MTPEEACKTVLTDAELHEWVLKHPAPQSWWDATDNPFEPEPGAEERLWTQGDQS